MFQKVAHLRSFGPLSHFVLLLLPRCLAVGLLVVPLANPPRQRVGFGLPLRLLDLKQAAKFTTEANAKCLVVCETLLAPGRRQSDIDPE